MPSAGRRATSCHLDLGTRNAHKFRQLENMRVEPRIWNTRDRVRYSRRLYNIRTRSLLMTSRVSKTFAQFQRSAQCCVETTIPRRLKTILSLFEFCGCRKQRPLRESTSQIQTERTHQQDQFPGKCLDLDRTISNYGCHERGSSDGPCCTYNLRLTWLADVFFRSRNK